MKRWMKVRQKPRRSVAKTGILRLLMLEFLLVTQAHHPHPFKIKDSISHGLTGGFEGIPIPKTNFSEGDSRHLHSHEENFIRPEHNFSQSNSSVRRTYATLKSAIDSDSDSTFVGSSLSLENTNASTSQKTRISNYSVSCEQRCGESTNYPCSCDKKCLVHKTCCEDMAHACPALFRLAVTKFDWLLSAAVRCDAITSVFTVESCPQRSSESGTQTSEGVNSFKNLPSVPFSDRTISEILADAPVTDYSTGIVFANASVYECNKHAIYGSFDASLNSMGDTWHTQVGTFNGQSPEQMNNVQDKIDLSTYSYVPSKSHSRPAGTLCYTQWTLSCISDLSRMMNIQQVTCNISVREFYEKREVFRIMSESDPNLREHICDFCLANYQGSQDRGNRYFFSGFKVLMSLSAENPGSVLYSVQEKPKQKPTQVPWKSWTCSVSDQTKGVENRSCEVLQCSQRFIFSPDGLCRKAVEVDISIQDEILFKGQRCRIDPEAFAEAAKCYLREFQQIKAIDTQIRISQVYSAQWGTAMTVIRMKMFYDVEKFEKHVVTLYASYHQFYAAILIFSQQYCSMVSGNIGRKNVKNNLANTTAQQALDPSPLVPSKGADISCFNSTGLQIEEMLKYFIFTVCIRLNAVDNSLTDDLKCDYWSVLDNSYGDRMVGDLFLKVNKLKCLRQEYETEYFFNTSTQNCGASLPIVFIIVASLAGYIKSLMCREQGKRRPMK